MGFQTTINTPVSCYGIGVHTGDRIGLTLKPAPADSGITFIRTDISATNNLIQAHFKNVYDTSMCTAIRNDAQASVSTIEHLMAAIWGCQVDNLLIEIDGPEVPIMDGSSAPFVFLIEYSGKQVLKSKRQSIRVLKGIYVNDNSAEAELTPAEDFSVAMSIEFDSKAIGKQEYQFCGNSSFKDNLAMARTFGFIEQIEHLKNKGLAQGASLDNAIGVQGDSILNKEGLRVQDEFARHKALDAIGDLLTSGLSIKGSFKGLKSGHHLNNLLLHKLFSDPNNYVIS